MIYKLWINDKKFLNGELEILYYEKCKYIDIKLYSINDINTFGLIITNSFIYSGYIDSKLRETYINLDYDYTLNTTQVKEIRNDKLLVLIS